MVFNDRFVPVFMLQMTNVSGSSIASLSLVSLAYGEISRDKKEPKEATVYIVAAKLLPENIAREYYHN